MQSLEHHEVFAAVHVDDVARYPGAIVAGDECYRAGDVAGFGDRGEVGLLLPVLDGPHLSGEHVRAAVHVDYVPGYHAG